VDVLAHGSRTLLVDGVGGIMKAKVISADIVHDRDRVYFQVAFKLEQGGCQCITCPIPRDTAVMLDFMKMLQITHLKHAAKHSVRIQHDHKMLIDGIQHITEDTFIDIR